MSKSILEYFKKYDPDREIREILDLATVTGVRVDRENKKIEMDVAFPRHISRGVIKRAELEAARAHEINGVRFIPSFPTETFGEEGVREAIEAAYGMNCLAQGFLSDYSVSIDGDTVTVFTRFADDGNEFITGSRTDRVISDLIFKMYNKRVAVQFRTADEGEISYESFSRQRNEEIASILADIEEERRN